MSKSSRLPLPVEEALKNFGRAITRVQSLLKLHRGLHGKRGRPRQQVADVLRGATVLAAGALDGLVLEVIVSAVPQAARHGHLGANAEKWAGDEPARVLQAFAQDNPHAELASLVREKLARTTFQKSAMIESNLRDVVGADPPWNDAAQILNQAAGDGGWTPEGVRDTLDDFMARRDRIAHSGDQKPNSAGALPIQIAWVERGVHVIDAVGHAVCTVVERRLM